MSDDETLQDLLASWYARHEAGENPQIEEHCAGAAHLLTRFSRLVRREAEVTGSLARITAPEIVPDEKLLTSRLGDFTLLRVIGSGGMGRVFIARQESLGRHVALKVLRGGDPLTTSDRLRFRREAEITAALDHPHIVPIYAIGEDVGAMFIAMKLLSGPSLAELETPLAPREAARIGVAVAQAAAAAHDIGVLHRDIKPANVILDGDHPYLADFGLARAAGDVTITGEGSAAGTLAYMAPERLRKRSAVLDPRTDVYSIGATLHDALTGSPPFDEDSVDTLIRRILVEEPPRLGLAPSDRDLETIIARALDKDPERRFATALDLADDLDRYLAGSPIHSRPLGLAARAWRKVRRHALTSTIAAASLIAITTLGALSWSANRRHGAMVSSATALAAATIDGGDYVQGRRDIESLRALDPASPAITELERAARAREAFDAMLDVVQGSADAINADELKELGAELAMADARFAESPPALLGRLVAAVATFDASTARPMLDRLASTGRFPRTRSVIAPIVDDIGPASRGPRPGLAASATSRPAEGVDAEDPATDHVLAACAMRLAGLPLEHQRAEIDAALLIRPEDYRARYASSVMAEAAGAIGVARAWAQGLTEHARHRHVAWQRVAHCEMLMGNLANAAICLDKADEAFRKTSLAGPWFALEQQRLELMRRTRSADELRTRLAKDLATWPDAPWLRMLSGALACAEGRTADARREFDRARECARLPAQRRRIDGMQLQADFAAAPGAGELMPMRESGAAASTFTEIAARAQALARTARACGDRPLEADCRLIEARALRLLGRRADAWNAAQAARHADPTNPKIDIHIANVLAARVIFADLPPEQWDDALVIDESAEARETVPLETGGPGVVASLDRIVVDASRGEVTLDAAEEIAAHTASAIIRKRLKDVEGARRSARRALELMSENNSPQTYQAGLLRALLDE